MINYYYIVIFLIIIAIILYYVFKKKIYNIRLLKGPQLLTQGYNKQINFNKMKPSNSGLKYTYIFWLYNINMPENGYWQNAFDNPKPIFKHYLSPDVYFLPDKNIVRISVGYKNNNGGLTGYDIDITNFKYQSWQQIAIVVDNRIVSIYLDGKLYTAANLPNVPWIANRMLNIGDPNNNSNNYIWNLEYYNDVLSNRTILKNYKKYKGKLPKLNNSYYNYFEEHQKQKKLN